MKQSTSYISNHRSSLCREKIQENTELRENKKPNKTFSIFLTNKNRAINFSSAVYDRTPTKDYFST